MSSDRTWDVADIVADWLKTHGYDGLYDDEGDGCGCRLGDLMPCGECNCACLAGVFVDPPEGACSASYYIGRKPDEVKP